MQQTIAIAINETAIRMRMLEIGIRTVEELAQRTETTSLTIRRWFQGGGFTSTNLGKLAGVLQLYTVDDLARILTVTVIETTTVA